MPNFSCRDENARRIAADFSQLQPSEMKIRYFFIFLIKLFAGNLFQVIFIQLLTISMH
jgi:hypothetical protein